MVKIFIFTLAEDEKPSKSMRMISRIYSAAVQGVEGVEIEVEVDAQLGTKCVFTVGLPDAAVKESAQRVGAAICNSGFRQWEETFVVNLAPADIRKQGPSFDLPIALGMIAAAERITLEADEWMIVGELSLDGVVRPVKGVLSLVLAARAQGRNKVMVPVENAEEAAVIEGMAIYPVGTLRDAWRLIAGVSTLEPHRCDRESLFARKDCYDVDFDEIKGQPFARRAMEVAAAGGHNILLCGSPGSGKSMFAQRLPGILPELSEEEAIETSKIHSVCGLLKKEQGLILQRPFRNPHHTISDVGLMGGGGTITPGEISLAHNGVLFLDELPEFHRRTLETLRQPLEAGNVVISRASGTVTFPSRFMLMAAMNPCPCGYLGDPKRVCRCLPGQIANYRRRISGPLLDRFDLLIEVPPVDLKSVATAPPGESSAVIRERVCAARARQRARFAKHPGVNGNAGMNGKLTRLYCGLDAASRELMNQAIDDMSLSARGHDRILRVSRTLADLEGCENISAEHLYEAIQFRQFELSLH